ncbi:MAG TPA: ATP-dependent DNA helicase [Acidobacteriota bacterium]|nr:ATP-dependent DNA helicase [Acidobacteriota bacterium]
MQKPYVFAHDNIRPEQEKLADATWKAVNDGSHILAHAPTGLGKTAAVLSPAVSYAMSSGKTILFLTSRYTQHALVLSTLKMLQEKIGVPFGVADIIAKKFMCAIPGAQTLSSSEFITYCRKLRENVSCDYYSNTRKKNYDLTVDGAFAVSERARVLATVQEHRTAAIERKVCPYEISIEIAKEAKVIIGDYNYVFHPRISENFLRKIQKKREDCIVIVDEAHNLADRVKDMTSMRLTTFITTQAIKEAEVFGQPKAKDVIQKIQSILETFSDIEAQEQLVTQDWLVDEIETAIDYNEATVILETAFTAVYEKQQRSFIHSVFEFLVAWQGESEGYTRIIRKDLYMGKQSIALIYRCLDPSIITKNVFDQSWATVLMSGTLNPIPFYKDILGLRSLDAKELEFSHPFPKENALHLIVPLTTTKYDQRSDEQFEEIAKITAEMCNEVPGNCVVFFPSYFLMNNVATSFMNKSKKTVFCEDPNFSKEERTQMLDSFKRYKDIGAVLLAVTTGSFGEGVDLPGDLLKCVIIVGLPLPKPDLESRQLIKYYDAQFAKGWDYGYIFPAFNKTLQNAGRCIRTETDRGVIIYLDKRYSWPQYFNCFPKDLHVQTSTEYTQKIKEFFK